jgi:hypothetical protein
MSHGLVHSLGAVSIFVAVVLLFRALKWIVGANFHAEAFCATACAIFFFFGRELRDREKLGYLDAEGLFVPVVVVTALALVYPCCCRPEASSCEQSLEYNNVQEDGVGFRLIASDKSSQGVRR